MGKKLPRTSQGFDKALAKIKGNGIVSRQQAADYAIMMRESIRFEMQKLQGFESNPMVEELKRKYQEIESKWTRIVDYTNEHLFDKIEENGK